MEVFEKIKLGVSYCVSEIGKWPSSVILNSKDLDKLMNEHNKEGSLHQLLGLHIIVSDLIPEGSFQFAFEVLV